MSRHFCYFCVHYAEHDNTPWTCNAEFISKEDAMVNQGKDCSYFKEGDWKHRHELISEYIFSDGRKLSVIHGREKRDPKNKKKAPTKVRAK